MCAHTDSHTHAQLAFGNMPDIAFLMLAQEVSVAAWSASFPVRGGGGLAPASAWGWLEGTDTQGLTSHAPLQPHCLPFPPSINELLGMRIFRDCKTMAEGRVGRLVVKKT